MTDNLKGGYKLTVEDGRGGLIDWFCYEDLILPKGFPDWFDPREKLQSIKQFQYREGDVLICSYPKSGILSQNRDIYPFFSLKGYTLILNAFM